MKRAFFADFLFPFVLFWIAWKAILPEAFGRWALVSAAAPGIFSGVILSLWAIFILLILGSLERPPLFYAFLTLASLTPLLPAQIFPPVPEPFSDLFRWGLVLGITGWVSRYMTREIILLPLTLVAITMDVFAFLRGVYARVLEVPSLSLLHLAFPALAHDASTPPFVPVLLFTDLFFLGYFFVCCYEMRLNRFWNAVLLFLVTAGALLIPATFGIRLPILPWIGGFFLVGNWRSLKFQKDEIGISFAFFAAMLILLAIMMVTGQ